MCSEEIYSDSSAALCMKIICTGYNASVICLHTKPEHWPMLIQLDWNEHVNLGVQNQSAVSVRRSFAPADLPAAGAADYLVCRWTAPPWPPVGFSAAAPGIGNTPPSLWGWPLTAPARRPDTARRCCSATGSGWRCPPRRGTAPPASCGLRAAGRRPDSRRVAALPRAPAALPLHSLHDSVKGGWTSDKAFQNTANRQTPGELRRWFSDAAVLLWRPRVLSPVCSWPTSYGLISLNHPQREQNIRVWAELLSRPSDILPSVVLNDQTRWNVGFSGREAPWDQGFASLVSSYWLIHFCVFLWFCFG